MAPVRQSDRGFGLTFAVVFVIVAGVGWLFFDALLYWALVVAAILLIVALAAPFVLMPFNRLWGALAARLSVVNNYILLGLFFYLIMAPVGLTRRLFGWDPMDRRRDSAAKTYWASVKRHTSAENLSDPF